MTQKDQTLPSMFKRQLHYVRFGKVISGFLVNKTNRRTEFKFYWYYDSTCFGQPSSGVLSRTSALVHFMQLW